jgi:hypothetical protein
VVKELSARIRDLSLQLCDDPIYLVLYGSSAKNARRYRDVDALLVCRKCQQQYVRRHIWGHTLNLHIVNQEMIDRDLVEDRFGWIFLTKFLDDFNVLYGSSELPGKSRTRAHLRILGQWAAQHGVSTITDFTSAYRAIVSTLRLWNPQFEVYVKEGRINLESYKRYITCELPRCEETKQLLKRVPSGLLFRKRSPFFRKADLRILLMRYWGYYVLYQVDRGMYLTPEVDRLLQKKGLI